MMDVERWNRRGGAPRAVDGRVRRRVGGWLLASASASGLLAACGDDADDGASQRREFIAAAEEICQQLDDEGTTLAAGYYGEDFSLEPSPEEQAEFFRLLVTQVEAGIAEIVALDGPDDGRELIERVVSADPFIPSTRDALELFDGGDVAGFEQAVNELFSGGVEPPAELVAEAEEYGFTGCVADGEDGGDDDHDESSEP